MQNNRAAFSRSLTDAVKIDQGMLRYVLDQARDCVKILSPDGQVDYINSEGRCALGISDLSAIRGKAWAELWPEDSKETIEGALKKARAGESSEIEAWRVNSRGERTWWRISVSPLVESDGDINGVLTISRDISHHVRLRESEQTLALEMRHRLRNAYTVASAIVMQSARNDPATHGFAELVCGRLADVALSQTRLLDAGEKSWYLADLISTLVEAHGEGPTSIRYAGAMNARVDGQEAMVVALVVGELTNNSLKYGALRHRQSVTLSWNGAEDSLTINWQERLGEGAADALRPRDASSGYAMMQRMARSQRAKFEHYVSDGVLHVTLALHHRKRAQSVAPASSASVHLSTADPLRQSPEVIR